MQENEIAEAVKEISKEGVLRCEDAHRLHREKGIPLAEIGRMADELGIKIKSCQLGCF